MPPAVPDPVDRKEELVSLVARDPEEALVQLVLVVPQVQQVVQALPVQRAAQVIPFSSHNLISMAYV